MSTETFFGEAIKKKSGLANWDDIEKTAIRKSEQYHHSSPRQPQKQYEKGNSSMTHAAWPSSIRSAWTNKQTLNLNLQRAGWSTGSARKEEGGPAQERSCDSIPMDGWIRLGAAPAHQYLYCHGVAKIHGGISANRELGNNWRSSAASLNSPRITLEDCWLYEKKELLATDLVSGETARIHQFYQAEVHRVVVIVSSSGMNETTNVGLCRCRYRISAEP